MKKDSVSKALIAVVGMLGLLSNAPTAAGGAEKPSAPASASRKEMTQSDLNVCYDKGRRATDAELGRRYDLLLSRLGGNPSKDLLRAAERPWISYRDADYAFGPRVRRPDRRSRWGWRPAWLT